MHTFLLTSLLLLAAAPVKDNAIRAMFTKEGFTLTITARCDRAEPQCPFEAQIDAPSPLFEKIEGVDYTYIPERRISPAPVKDAASHFRFEGRQTHGENVWAKVKLKGEGDAAAKTFLLEGKVPYAVEVTPPLPTGLRFEDSYVQQYMEGTPIDYYLFCLNLRGEAGAVARIRSVHYQIVDSADAKTKISPLMANDFYLEVGMRKDAKWDVTAVIRWKDGNSTTHKLPVRPR